jgi:hypothetical protein
MLADGVFVRTPDELDRLLNDPDVPTQPALIWRLVAEISQQGSHGGTTLSRLPTRMRLFVGFHGAGLGSRLQVTHRASHRLGQLLEKQPHGVGRHDKQSAPRAK